MAVALRDFRYHDRERNESVQVRAGDKVDATALSHHGVDVAKLGRVKFMDLQISEGAERPREVVPVKRKRGRPRKIV